MRLPAPHQLRDPMAWASGLQLVKTVAAVVIAWVLADRVLGLSQSFLAPWAALLTVHATVFGSLRHGVQQVGATVLGVLLAFVAGGLFGVSALSIGVAVFVGLAAGAVRGLRAETTTAAATALVVLTTGYDDEAGPAGRTAARHRDRRRDRFPRESARMGAVARPRRGA
jgi:uncharacterized membrane protein YgaE (UPF0421/DUF939 family)